MVVAHIRMAAEMIEAFIAGRMILKKVFNGETPRLIDASSMDSGMLKSVEEALRTAKGRRRTA